MNGSDSRPESPGQGHGRAHATEKPPVAERPSTDRGRGKTFGHRRVVDGSVRPSRESLHGRRRGAPGGPQDAQ
eukprot:12667797-Heterocapsa_arctica.AAC.1